jgi:hypothetical protein
VVVRLFSLSILGLIVGAGFVAASCTATNDNDRLSGGSESGPTAGNTGGSGSGGFNPVGSGGSTGECNSAPGVDSDADGYASPEDCNDCDVNVNPGAVEVPTDPMDPDAEMSDENCDGSVDEAIQPCDMGLIYTDTAALNAAKAMEICTQATPGGNDYGVLQANWVRANGTPAAPASQLAFGIQQNFGTNVPTQRGENMLMLSSGHARLPGQTDAAINHVATTTGYTTTSPAPMNFPQNVPGCAGDTLIYDDVGLELLLRSPTNATGFKFLFKFYSFEFAEYVCTNFNDQFIALVNPAPTGSINGNVSFDSQGNPVSVNIAFFDVCDPNTNNDFAMWCGMGCPPMPNPYCPSGPAELAGSGFDNCFGSLAEDAGGTSWLQTTSPVGPGDEFTIRFAIWDTGDNAYDSTVLVDGFEWVASPGTTVITEPPPE